ncbi:hypothetical protein A2U01_0015960, partial [Trifolium medium]|nr:hypothetical protein [Trifolium medium]
MKLKDREVRTMHLWGYQVFGAVNKDLVKKRYNDNINVSYGPHDGVDAAMVQVVTHASEHPLDPLLLLKLRL